MDQPSYFFPLARGYYDQCLLIIHIFLTVAATLIEMVSRNRCIFMVAIMIITVLDMQSRTCQVAGWQISSNNMEGIQGVLQANGNRMETSKGCQEAAWSGCVNGAL